MARITPTGQDTLPNPSKVFREEPKFGESLVGLWTAVSPRQAWARLDITAQQRIKITVSQNLMSGIVTTHPTGELHLSLYAGAGESTTNLSGNWRLEGDELFLEFRAMEMHFRRARSTRDSQF